MVQEIDRLEIGIGNLLTAAGLRSATRAINPTPGDLAKDLRKVLDELRGRFETAGIELDSGALPPVEIVRDPSAMHIVLHCLLDNAVKYSPAGSQVRVSLSDLGDQAELRVADSGHGMTREDQQRAFEPFYRGAQREHTGGSGLGLYLVDELVRLHGGEVSASSPGPGQGSEFVIRLPKGRCAS